MMFVYLISKSIIAHIKEHKNDPAMIADKPIANTCRLVG
jgi:hypothetical protein